MPGRHDVRPPARRRWAPAAFDAVVAVTPNTSLVAALGLAGGGYLAGREEVAACGALVGALGLAVERIQHRSVRVRARRERARYRDGLQGVGVQLNELRRELTGLRQDLDGVRDERDSIRAELTATQDELANVRVAVATAAPVVPSAPVVPVTGPITMPIRRPTITPASPGVSPAAVAKLPGQVRSPIATGGIPLLNPGPRMPVPGVIDLRSRFAAAPPARDPELADAMVYAAMAEAEAQQLAQSLEIFGLHAGDAHHAGDYSRGPVVTPAAGTTLLVVKRGKHVA